MDANPHRRPKMRAASPKFPSGAFAPLALCASAGGAGPKDPAGATPLRERSENLLKPPPIPRGADGRNGRRRPSGGPCRAASLRPARGASLQRRPAESRRSAAAAPGIGRRHIVLDAKQQGARVQSGRRGVAQMPHEAWIQAVLAGNAQRSREYEGSGIESRPPLARKAPLEGRAGLSSVTRFPRMNSAKAATASTRSTTVEGCHRSESAGHRRSTGFSLMSPLRRSNGSTLLVSSPSAVTREQTVGGTTVQQMISYCRKLEPYQHKVKELREHSNDVQEALRRFVDRCGTHRRPGGSNFSAMTAVEEQANSLTEGLRELQRYTVTLLLRFSEYSSEAHRPLGSSKQQIAQQLQEKHRVAAPVTDTSRQGVTEATASSGFAEKFSALKNLSTHTTDTLTSQQEVPPCGFEHPLSTVTQEEYLRFLCEEEYRIVHELHNVCTRVRQVLKHDSTVMLGDATILNTPLFLPSHVDRFHTEASAPSPAKIGTNPTFSHSATANHIRPIVTSGSKGTQHSTGNGTGGRNSLTLHHKVLSEESEVDVAPYFGVSLTGLYSGTEAGNARLVLGGGRRCHAMSKGALPPLARHSARGSRGKLSNSAAVPKRATSKISAGISVRKVNGKAGAAVSRNLGVTDLLSSSQVREAQCVWERIRAITDTSSSAPTARQMKSSVSRNESVEEVQDQAPEPTKHTVRRATSASKSKSVKASPVVSALREPKSIVRKASSLSLAVRTPKTKAGRITAAADQTKSSCGGDDEGMQEGLETQPSSMLHDVSTLTIPEQNLNGSRDMNSSLELCKTKELKKEMGRASSFLCPSEPNTQTGIYTDLDAKKTSFVHRCAEQKRSSLRQQEVEQEQLTPKTKKNLEVSRNMLQSRLSPAITDLTVLSVEKKAVWAKMVTRIASYWRMYKAKVTAENLRAQAAVERSERQQSIYESTMAGRIQRFFSTVVARRKFHEATQRQNITTPSYFKGKKRNIKDKFECCLSVRGYLDKVKNSRLQIHGKTIHSSSIETEPQLNDEGENPEKSRKSHLSVIPSLNLEAHNLSTYTIDTYAPGAENFDVAVLHRLLRAPKTILHMLRVMCESYPSNRDLADAIHTEFEEFKECKDMGAEKRSHDASLDNIVFSTSSLSISPMRQCSMGSTSSLNSSIKRERGRQRPNGGRTSLGELRKNMQWELRPYRVVRRERILAEAQRFASKYSTTQTPPPFLSSPEDARWFPLPPSIRVESFVEDVDAFHAVPVEKSFARPFERWGAAYAFQRRVFAAAAVYAWKLIFSHTPHDDYKQGLLKTQEEKEARLSRVDLRNRMILACYCVSSEKEWLKEASKDLAFVVHIYSPKSSLDPNDPDFDRQCRETFEFVEDFLYQCFPTVTNLEDVPAFLTGAGIFFMLKGVFESPKGAAVSLEAVRRRVAGLRDALDLLDRLTDWSRPRARSEGKSRRSASREDTRAHTARPAAAAKGKKEEEEAAEEEEEEEAEETQSETRSICSSRESADAMPDGAGTVRRRTKIAVTGEGGGVRVQCREGFLVSLSERLAYSLLGISLDLEVCEDLDAVA